MTISPFAPPPSPAAASGKTWTELYPPPADPWGSQPIDHGAYRAAIRATIAAGRNPFGGTPQSGEPMATDTFGVLAGAL